MFKFKQPTLPSPPPNSCPFNSTLSPSSGIFSQEKAKLKHHLRSLCVWTDPKTGNNDTAAVLKRNIVAIKKLFKNLHSHLRKFD
jgi:hypothetical protein